MTLEGEEIGSHTSVKVKLSVAQIGTVILAAASVIGSVWVTTDQLQREVARLSDSINHFDKALDSIQRTDHVLEKRVSLIEARELPPPWLLDQLGEQRLESRRLQQQIDRLESAVFVGRKPPLQKYAE